jgi:hypothetical protein
VQLTKEIYGKVASAIMVRKLLHVYIFFVLVAITLVTNSIFLPPESMKSTNYPFPGILTIIFFTLTLYFIALPILQYQFGFGWKKHPMAAQLTKYSFSEKGLNAEGETYHTFQAWENFIGIKQMRSAVVLFLTQNQISVFPNESFSSAQQRQDIVAFVSQHIPPEKYKLLKFSSFKKIIVVLICAYLFIVIVGNIWTQVWVRLDKNRPMTDAEKTIIGLTGELKVNDRIWLGGGYEPDPEWRHKGKGYPGTVEFFMPGQNEEPAAVVKLDKKITVEGITGDILVLELRSKGAKWGDEGIVHLELCDFVPERRPWKERKQGKWIESHAHYRKLANDLPNKGSEPVAE